MKKLISLLVVGTVVFAGLATPASAAKKKKAKKAKVVKVAETMTAQLLPFPKNSNLDQAGFTKPGCTSGEEGVHWVAVPFTAPGKGTLRFYMEGFTGDHDIYVYLDENVFLRGDTAQVGPELAPASEEISVDLTKGQEVSLAMCNWAGDVNVEAHYEGAFKA